MRHVVVVDGQASTTQIGTACQPYAIPERQAPNFVQEIRALHHRINAVSETATGNAQMIHRHGERYNKVRTADLYGREPQVLSNLIQMDLECETRLWCAVPTLRTTRGLVSKNTQPLEAVMWDFIGDRLQRPSVEDRGHAIAAIPAAIHECLKVECSDGAIALHPGTHPHQHWMAPTVRIKHLFTCEAD